MTHKITWLGDTTSLDLKPTWEVDKVRFHTVPMMAQPDGSRKDTFVVAFIMNADQCRKLQSDYAGSMGCINMLGTVVVPLYPNAVLWTWKAPVGYPSIKDGTYTAFEMSEV